MIFFFVPTIDVQWSGTKRQMLAHRSRVMRQLHAIEQKQKRAALQRPRNGTSGTRSSVSKRHTRAGISRSTGHSAHSRCEKKTNRCLALFFIDIFCFYFRFDFCSQFVVSASSHLPRIIFCTSVIDYLLFSIFICTIDLQQIICLIHLIIYTLFFCYCPIFLRSARRPLPRVRRQRRHNQERSHARAHTHLRHLLHFRIG